MLTKISKLKKKSLKNKQNILYVILGAGITFLAFSIYQYVILPGAERLLYSKFPEIVEVSRVVHNRYKDGNITVNVKWNTSYGAEKKTTSSLVIVYESKNSLSDKDMRSITQIACNKLDQINKPYDKVVVISRKNLLPFNIPFIHADVNDVHSGKC